VEGNDHIVVHIRKQPRAHQMRATLRAMNRPRNRQPRPPRSENNRGSGSRRTGPPSDVPSVHQVVPGAGVSIVLKADQPTGRQVQGIVQDLLTRGNHPRGIKVRLQDGRVGRVQRMVNDVPAGGTSQGSSVTQQTATRGGSNRILRMERDVRLDEHDYPEGPPQRTFADYFPQLNNTSNQDASSLAVSKAATAKCPMCDFEGDEIAVSRHVDEHLT
jgi:uncharacterized repeat protein (TIGR03833 family)